MKGLKQAVILAGGLGTRLGEKTASLPKPMMDIAGRPYLDYLIRHLVRQGIEDVLLSVGYLHESIVDFFGDGSDHGLSIRYVTEDHPLGTGGALRNCLPHLAERFFVLNGDTLFDVNLAALETTSGRNVMALRSVPEMSRYGGVKVHEGIVTRFVEKGDSGPGHINGGVLCLNRSALEHLPDGRSSIELDLLPALVANGTLAAFTSNGFFIDIGLPETLDRAQTEIPAWERKPIAFLDRDGVLNHDSVHLFRIEEFEWIPGAVETVRLLNDSGYHVVIATNQGGIAKGVYTEEDFFALTKWMRGELWRHGAHFDAVYHCPYHAEGTVERYRRESDDRKPNPGMLLRAMRELPHDFHGSFFIGDQASDRAAAAATGIPYFGFPGGNLFDFVALLNRPSRGAVGSLSQNV
jgi:D-glycero-D-manno-heptose 1,7-bisphosphate phosphatase